MSTVIDRGVPFKNTMESRDKVARAYQNDFDGIIQYLSFRMGVYQTRQDLAQSFWEKVIKHWERVVNADSPLDYMYGMAVNTVRSASSFRLRVHVRFVSGANVESVLADLGVDKNFKRLKIIWDDGSPIYSGRVSRKKLQDLRENPYVEEVKEKIAFERTREFAVQRHSEAMALVHLLTANLEQQRRVFLLRDLEQRSFTEISEIVGLSITACRKYYRQIIEILQDSPELKEIWDSSRDLA